MREQIRNRIPVWYANFIGKHSKADENGDETGDYEDAYSVPVKFFANVAPNSGDVNAEPFGNNLLYSRVLFTVQDLPIREGARVWLTEPETSDTDASEADYIVIGIAKSINATRYALYEVKKSKEV